MDSIKETELKDDIKKELENGTTPAILRQSLKQAGINEKYLDDVINSRISVMFKDEETKKKQMKEVPEPFRIPGFISALFWVGIGFFLGIVLGPLIVIIGVGIFGGLLYMSGKEEIMWYVFGGAILYYLMVAVLFIIILSPGAQKFAAENNSIMQCVEINSEICGFGQAQINKNCANNANYSCAPPEIKSCADLFSDQRKKGTTSNSLTVCVLKKAKELSNPAICKYAGSANTYCLDAVNKEGETCQHLGNGIVTCFGQYAVDKEDEAVCTKAPVEMIDSCKLFYQKNKELKGYGEIEIIMPKMGE